MLKLISRLIFGSSKTPSMHIFWFFRIFAPIFFNCELFFCDTWYTTFVSIDKLVTVFSWSLQLRKFKIVPACLRWQNSPRSMEHGRADQKFLLESSTNGSHDQKWHQSLVETLQPMRLGFLSFWSILIVYLSWLCWFFAIRPFLYLEDISGMCRLLPPCSNWWNFLLQGYCNFYLQSKTLTWKWIFYGL